jgi:PBP1b-binding outer membrane lipoprotein LpoB
MGADKEARARMVTRHVMFLFVGMALLQSACTRVAGPPSSPYVPWQEAGVTTVGLDDHDYSLAVAGIARAMIRRGLKDRFVVALGPVDTADTPYNVRVVMLQKSLQATLSEEGSLRFTGALGEEPMTGGGTSQNELFKIIQFNWLNRNPVDMEALQTLGRLAHVNGILFGRVSSMERSLPGGGTEVTYRFMWELMNTENGIIEIAHEERIRKNVR